MRSISENKKNATVCEWFCGGKKYDLRAVLPRHALSGWWGVGCAPGSRMGARGRLMQPISCCASPSRAEPMAGSLSRVVALRPELF